MFATSIVTHKFNPDPRVSANQLADYLKSNSTRRRAILQDAKYPPTAPLLAYSEAKPAFIEHFVGPANNNALDNRLKSLQRKIDNPETTDFQRQQAGLSADAIESFQYAALRMKLGALQFSQPDLSFHT